MYVLMQGVHSLHCCQLQRLCSRLGTYRYVCMYEQYVCMYVQYVCMYV